jgi:membrane peptidoglycan carboxypeptidase
LQRILASVVTTGTGRLSRPDGYTAAGKTGTAQKIDPANGRYSPTDHVASFVGYVPAESPMFTILVALDSPRGRYHGGDVAAPIFKRVAAQVLAYRNVPAIVPGPAPAVHASTREPDLPPLPVLFEEPNPTALISLTSSVLAPDLSGKTVRAATEQALGEKWTLHPIGNGIAVQQFPLPGTPIAEGQKITVWFRISGRAEEGKQPGEKHPSAPKRVAPAPGIALPPGSPMRSESPAEAGPVAG